MLAGRDVDLQLNIREVYRYLGYRGSEPEAEIKQLIDSCIEEVKAVSELRGMYERFSLVFPAEEEGEGSMTESPAESMAKSLAEDMDEPATFSIGGIPVTSRDLKKNLWGCQYVYLMGATIGIGIDRLIARAYVSDMTKAAIYQAVGAAYVEDYCNHINQEIADLACQEEMTLRPRFSPGYGDLDLDYQKDIFRLLNLSKHIGISLTDSMVMSPNKSVTAIIGVVERGDGSKTNTAQNHRGKKCKLCPKLDCQFREE